MHYFLGILFFFCAVFAQRSVSIDFGFLGYVPQVYKYNDAVDVSENNSLVSVKLPGLWRQDKYPFAWNGGFFGELLLNNNKVSYGAGYSIESDYHNYTNVLPAAGFSNGFSARIAVHSLYGKIIWHMKHEQASSLFFGVTGGLLGYQIGVSERASYIHDNNTYLIPRAIETEEQKDAFMDKVKYTHFSPGLTCSIIAGFKLYIGRQLMKKLKFKVGIRVYGQYSFSTPSFPVSAYKQDGAQTGIENVSFRFDHSGFLMRLSLFTEIDRL
jgi:hypothetical protein